MSGDNTDIPDKAEVDVLFMVVEKFRNQDGKAVYRKLRDAGRSLPDGLKFVASYVSADLGRCFQLMETDDVTLFQRWIFFFSSRRRHTRCSRDWSSDVCSSDLIRRPHRGRPRADIRHGLRRRAA